MQMTYRLSLGNIPKAIDIYAEFVCHNDNLTIYISIVRCQLERVWISYTINERLIYSFYLIINSNYKTQI